MPIGRYENDEIRRLREKRSAEGGVRGGGIDRDIAFVADRQGGQIHREQLRDLGLGGRGVDHRVAAGRLHPSGRSTYGVGHPRGDHEARLHAALLVAGDGAVLSHRTGGTRWVLLSIPATPIDITVPKNHRHRRDVRYYHRCLPADEVDFQEGMPVTSVGRTLFDLAGALNEYMFRRVVKEIAVQRLDCIPTLPVLLERHPRSPGAGLIRAVIAEGSVPLNAIPTDGDERFLALIRQGGFPQPAHRYGIPLAEDWLEVDFAWPSLRIVVEVDSSFHEVPIAIETDHERDQGLLAAGWHVFRVTWRQLHDDPDGVLRRLRAFFEAVVADRSLR